jgi:NAD(P)-dependent dehydrogenase (short-subunit alcohol dehydrogenase family)
LPQGCREQGDASNLADLDRLYETVKKEKGRTDVLFASAGTGEFAAIGEVTEEHFEKIFGVNVRGTLFTVQKAESCHAESGKPRASVTSPTFVKSRCIASGSTDTLWAITFCLPFLLDRINRFIA